MKTEMEQKIESVKVTPAVLELARQLQATMPSLPTLSREALEDIAKSVVFQRLVRELDFEVSVAGIDCDNEISLFLEYSATKCSKLTVKSYANDLKRLKRYCVMVGRRIIELTPQYADNYLLHLISQGYSSSSVATAASVASNLCSFIERRHSDGVTIRFRNPFKGTRSRPKPKPAKPLLIPTEEEVQFLLKRLPPKQAAMAAIMSELGLRCGAFNTLKIEGNTFSCFTKGKEMTGTISNDLLRFLKRRLKMKKLFTDMSIPAVKMSMKYHIGKLYKKGLLKANYSSHDLRHFFAVREYAKDKDIWRVSRLLNHSSLGSTEKYLKGLDRIT